MYSYSVSRVTCHITFFFGGGASRWRVCYQRGLSRLVSFPVTSLLWFSADLYPLFNPQFDQTSQVTLSEESNFPPTWIALAVWYSAMQCSEVNTKADKQCSVVNYNARLNQICRKRRFVWDHYSLNGGGVKPS